MSSVFLSVVAALIGSQPSSGIRLTATAGPDQVVVHVEGQTGRPIEGATVELLTVDGQQALPARTTDAQGNAVFSGLAAQPGDSFRARASKGSLVTESTTLQWVLRGEIRLRVPAPDAAAASPTTARELACRDVLYQCLPTCEDYSSTSLCGPCSPICCDPCSPICCGPCSPICNPCFPVLDPCTPVCAVTRPTATLALVGNPRTGTARLTISVPDDAIVTINGHRTTSTGTRRAYVTGTMLHGRNYKYVVLVQVVRNGQVIEETREVRLTPGEQESLAIRSLGGSSPLLTSTR